MLSWAVTIVTRVLGTQLTHQSSIYQITNRVWGKKVILVEEESFEYCDRVFPELLECGEHNSHQVESGIRSRRVILDDHYKRKWPVLKRWFGCTLKVSKGMYGSINV